MVQAKARYQEMDALRGLGACSVALSHFVIAFVDRSPMARGQAQNDYVLAGNGLLRRPLGVALVLYAQRLCAGSSCS